MGRGPVHRHRRGPSGRRRRVVDGRMGKRKQKMGRMGRDEWGQERSRRSDRGDETVGREGGLLVGFGVPSLVSTWLLGFDA